MAGEESTLPLYFQDASALAKLIRSKQVSPVEVVTAHLERIAAVNPRINAVVTLLAERALKASAQAERAVMAGETLGRLHGVPFTVKDSIDTAGVRTQRGSRLFADHIPVRNATVVERFERAGGILLAKTNVPEFSAWWETDNRVTGRTNNPWNLDRTAGGSSGGESAAISAGLSPIGMGSDVAISLRGPAALTGIAALKATHGRIPLTGHFPAALSRFWHLGPMARTMRDIALGYSLLSGPDGIDGYAVYPNEVKPEVSLPEGAVRVGWVAASAFSPIDPEIVASVQQAALNLETLGHLVEEVHLKFLEQHDWIRTFFTLWYGELAASVQQFGAGREEELHFIGAALFSRRLPLLSEYVEAEHRVEQLKRAFAGYFEKYDVLLCPVNPFTAPPHGLQKLIVDGQTAPAEHVIRATVPFNLTGLPALSVPFRLSTERLPINIQLVSRWLDETTILRLGAQLEAGNGLHGLRPVP